MITLRQVFEQSKTNHTAIPAFNIDSFEIFQAVESVVREINKPCIVQLSAGEDKFIQAEKLFLLVKKSRLEGLPIYLNMDHGENTDRLFELLQLGFDMVHFDGSKTEYQTNLIQTTQFISQVKSQIPDCLIEAEFNHINLVDQQVSSDSFTKPDQAVEFITQTKADLLAISIGNLHGVNQKLPEKIDLNLLQQINSVLPNQFFTLHGGSGIPNDQVKSSLQYGIVKMNINTDLRLCFLSALNKYLPQNKSEKIYDLFGLVINDLKQVIKDKFSCLM
jgi:fructose-bisphosphate aldolase class II